MSTLATPAAGLDTSASDFNFDWTVYLNEDEDDAAPQQGATGTTPELDESQPDDLTPSSTKDEAKTPENAQLGKAQMLAKLQQRSPQVAESDAASPSGSSVSSTKRKFSDLVVSTTAEDDDSTEKRKKATPPAQDQHSMGAAASKEVFDISDPDAFDQIDWPRADYYRNFSSSSVPN